MSARDGWLGLGGAWRAASGRGAWIAFAAAFALLWLPTLMMLDPTPVWDDALFIQAYLVHPIKSALEPFALGSVPYWRPLSTLTMGATIELLRSDGEAWFMLAGKAASLAIFLGVGLGAGALAVGGRGRSGAALGAALGAIMAAHPMMAEPSMWWSDRFDLLMCGWALALYWLVADSKGGAGLACALAIGACLTKESGFLWAGAAMSIAMARGRRAQGAGLLLGAAGAFCARSAALSWMPFAFFDAGAGFSGPWSWSLAASGLGRCMVFAALPWADPGPLHLASDLAWSWLAGVAGWALACFWAVRAWRRRGAAEGSSWAWGAACLGVAAVQCALVAFADPGLTHPAYWTRYAAPSFAVGLALFGRWAGSCRAPSTAAFCALAFALACAPWAASSKLAFSSQAELWAAVYRGHPEERFAAQYCAELGAVGEWGEAREVAERWRSAHRGEPAPLLDKALGGHGRSMP